jgi:hypothetical protein
MVDTESRKGRRSRDPRACRRRASRSRFEPERPGAAERRELERLGRGERVGALVARAREIAARSSSKKSCEGTDETPSVPMPTRRPGGSKLCERRDPAAEQAFERGQCATATPCGEQLDLLVVDLDAVCGDDALVEQACAARRRIPLCPSGRSSISARRLPRPFAAEQPVELVLALVEVRHHRYAERGERPPYTSVEQV